MTEQFTDFFKNFQPAVGQFETFKKMFPVNEQYLGVAKNLFPGNENFINAVRSSVEWQASYLTAIATTAIESAEKVADLNMNAAKASVEESTVIAQQLLASKDPQEFISLVTALPQPTLAKVAAYIRHLAEITSAAQAEITRTTEASIEETGRKFLSFFDQAAKHAPAGSESAIAVMKTAITNANAGYEQLAKAGKQAAEVIEANVNTAVDQVAQAAGTAAGRKGK